MPNAPTWTILVATLAQRSDRLTRLLDDLLPQTEPYAGSVRVCALYNRGERSLGAVRQDLVDSVTTEYLSFVDDDDRVPDYHVQEVMTAVSGVPELPDYVGWRMQCYVDGAPLKPTYHSLEYSYWFDDANGYYRDVSHLNPIKASVARRADFRRGEPPEDVAWATQVRDLVTSQVYVDRVMYHYYSSPSDSTWNGAGIMSTSSARPVITHPNFTYHPASST